MSSHRQFPYHLHISRAVLASLAVVAVGILYLPTSSPVAPIATQRQTGSVLAYATNINATDLATGTNAARAQNGLGPLSVSSKLSVSAQLKANDMISKDYWAHVSPDGTQPWYWFTQAGYDYINAGENLAYGFDTSDSVMTAWMNSSGHRANILGNYQDMGFGIANGDNYQGGQNTVVVAHYGTSHTTAPAPVVAPVASAPATPAQAAPSTPATPVPSSPAAPAPTAPSTSTAAPTTQDNPTKLDTTKPQTAVASAQPVSIPTGSTSIPIWKQLLSGTAPAIVLISITILAVVCIGYMATHISLVRHATLLGEQYVLHHPLIDASVTVGASAIVLITTHGQIR